MTVGQALERAEELRPGSRIARATRCAWLKEADAMLRQRFFKNSITDAYDEVGADLAWDDGLQDEDVLLAPEPFDAMYPHYLCHDRRGSGRDRPLCRRAGPVQQPAG